MTFLEIYLIGVIITELFVIAVVKTTPKEEPYTDTNTNFIALIIIISIWPALWLAIISNALDQALNR